VITVIVALLALPAQVGHDFRLPPSDVARAEVRAVEVTSDGSVWFGIGGRGLARISGGNLEGGVEWVTEADGLFSDGVADLMEDSGGRLWAVGFGGFSLFDGSTWSSQTQVGDLVPRVVFGSRKSPQRARSGSDRVVVPADSQMACGRSWIKRAASPIQSCTRWSSTWRELLGSRVAPMDGSLWCYRRISEGPRCSISPRHQMGQSGSRRRLAPWLTILARTEGK